MTNTTAAALLQRRLDDLRAEPPCPLPHIELRRGAGAYICGEESAMIESIEGKRGEPACARPTSRRWACLAVPRWSTTSRPVLGARHRRARPAVVRQLWPPWPQGLRSFSVSGRVKHPASSSRRGHHVQELIDEYCGGMLDGHELYAYLPGGASGGILPASLNQIPLDFDTLQPYGCFIGSAGRHRAQPARPARDAALNVMRFLNMKAAASARPAAWARPRQPR